MTFTSQLVCTWSYVALAAHLGPSTTRPICPTRSGNLWHPTEKYLDPGDGLSMGMLLIFYGYRMLDAETIQNLGFNYITVY